MSAPCPNAGLKTAPPEDRRRRYERRASIGELVVRASRKPRRPPENMAESVMPLDKRTKLGKALAAFREGLMHHCGIRPSETQRALIELCCQLKGRLVLMDAAFNTNGSTTAHDGKQYLAWSNSLTRTLVRLGLNAAPDPPARWQPQPYMPPVGAPTLTRAERQTQAAQMLSFKDTSA